MNSSDKKILISLLLAGIAQFFMYVLSFGVCFGNAHTGMCSAPTIDIWLYGIPLIILLIGIFSAATPKK